MKVKGGIEVRGIVWLKQPQLEAFSQRFTLDQWRDIANAAKLAGQVSGSPLFSGAAAFYNETIIHRDPDDPSTDVLDGLEAMLKG